MALGLADLLRIKQEMGYYGAGGGRRSEGEQIGGTLGSAGQGLSAIAQGIGQGQDIYKKRMESEKSKLELGAYPDMLKNQILKAALENRGLEQGITPLPDIGLTPSLFQKYASGIKDLRMAAKEKQKVFITESEFRNRNAKGERLSPEKYQIIPDPASIEHAGEIPPAQAGLYTLSNESIGGVGKAAQTLFPKGTPESFRRDIAVASNIPGSSLPVIGHLIPNASPFNKEAQEVNRWVGNALAGRQLIQTGVAARPEETQNLVNRFMAGLTSDPQSAQAALQELQKFYQDYNTVLTTRKPLPPTPTPNLDRLLSGGNQGQNSNQPQVGAIEDGYVFKGGDPANPNSWVKQ